MQKQQQNSDICRGVKKRTLADACDFLTQEWDLLKNHPLTPLDLLISDPRKVHWKCSGCGHEFQESVKNRYYRKAKCPNCWGRVKRSSEQGIFEQSLGYLYPYLMREWHPKLNGQLNAFELTPLSASRVWWRCSEGQCGHEWRASVRQRVYQGTGCPVCEKRAMSVGACYPELIKEWNPANNQGVLLMDLNQQSNRSGVWTCARCLNEYQMGIQDRLKQGVACPYCRERTEIKQRARLYLIRAGQGVDRQFNRASRMKVYQLRHS